MSAAVDTALRSALLAIPDVDTLAPGGVHNTLRRQGCDFPVIVFTLVPGQGDSPRFGGTDGTERLRYDVKVIATANNQTNVGAIIDAVHAALQGQPLTIAGVTHGQTLRVARIPNYAETRDGGVTYLHRGATYEITIYHPAP